MVDRFDHSYELELMLLNERQRNNTLLNLTQISSEYRLTALRTRFSWLLATQSFVAIAKLCTTKPVCLLKKKANRFGLVSSVTQKTRSISKRKKFHSQTKWLISLRLQHKLSKLKRRKKSRVRKRKSLIKSQLFSVLTSVARCKKVDVSNNAKRPSSLK